MKRIFTLLLAASALTAAVSCQKEISAPETEAPVYETMTITASTAAETKTSLGENGYSSFWSAGDQISVFDSNKGANNRCFTIVEENVEFPAKTATFSYTGEFVMPQNEQPNPTVVALYPYQENAYCDFFYYDHADITGINLPAEQTAVANGFDSDATFALALGTMETKEDLAFNNLYSLLRFTVSSPNVKKVTVTIEGEDAFIAGEAKIDLTINLANVQEGKPAFESPVLTASGSKTVTLTCEEGFATDATYYIAVAPVAYTSLAVVLDEVEVKKSTTAKTLKANTVYGLGELKMPALTVLQDELNAGGNVSLTSDVTVSASAGLSVPAGKTVTLDLGGNELTVEGSNFVNNGTLTITNGTVSGNDTQAGRRAIVNNGTLTLENVTVNQIYKAGGAAIINDGGTMIINEGTTVFAANMAISNKNKAILTINGGEFTGAGGPNDNPSYCICNQLSSELTVNGGTFIGNHGALANTEGSVATLNAGTFKAEGERAYYAIYCAAQTGDPAHVTYHPTNVILDASTALAGGKKTIYVGNDGSTVTPIKQERNLAFSVTSFNATLRNGFIAPELSGEDTGVTYTSSTPSVATVDSSTGTITLVSSGSTTITASADANDYYYAGSASYTLTVTPGVVRINIKVWPYFHGWDNWKQTPTIHYWGDYGETQWPGLELTKNTDGDKSDFYYEFEYSKTKKLQFLVNNGTGGEKSGDSDPITMDKDYNFEVYTDWVAQDGNNWHHLQLVKK